MDEQKNNQNDEELIGLSNLPGIVYAEMVKEALERQGIKSIIKPDVMSSGLQAKGAHITGDSCRIFVFKKDAEKAQEILETMMDHI
ncbi:DUF2007 domain-containing protein [candidate division KSB1 bacterium]|nr:DUF2007 domain-containing protein [candidate division KSB1 bacterium]